MFDFSWSEILLVAVVALVVIGPKDLPRVLRTAGQWMGRARTVAREFQFQVDQLVRESELDEVRKHMTDVASLDPKRMIGNWIDPGGEIANQVADHELLGETAPMPTVEPAPTDEPELPLLAPAPIASGLEHASAEPAEAKPETAATPVEAKSGTHG